MSTTNTRPPLLSEYDLSNGPARDVYYVDPIHMQKREVHYMSPHHVRDLYEAARAKDAELIQQLVNALCDSQPNHHEDAHSRYNDAFDAASAAGFKPSDQ